MDLVKNKRHGMHFQHENSREREKEGQDTTARLIVGVIG